MRISVCIATVRPDCLPRAIASVAIQDWPDWELVLVPQGSDRALLQVCENSTIDPRVRVVHLPHRGLSRARNAGAAAATGDIVAFTDDDCEPAPDWLTQLAAPFLADPALGLVGGAVVAPVAPRFSLSTCPALCPAETTYRPATDPSPPPGWDWMGANFAVRAEVLRELGPFDEFLGAGATFPAGEDTDYKLRLESAGIPMHTTPRAVVHHTYGSRRGLRNRRKFQVSYASGNGALAGKLALRGDPRGQQWVDLTHDYCFSQLARGRLDRFIRAFPRYRTYVAAFRRCCEEFGIGSDGNLVCLT
jgi:GT2 family glycosyltransferase